MIEIKVKTSGDETEYSCKTSGNGAEIVLEAVTIMTRLPEQLLELDPKLFKVFRLAFQKEIKRITEKMEAEEASHGTQQN